MIEGFKPQTEALHTQEEIEKENPNSIGEILSIGKDLPTSPDSVYRSVRGKEGIDDVLKVGFVRNAYSAGAVPHSRWGERVFWSRGAEEKYHAVAYNSYVIEAPYAVASERAVTKEDITAVYVKNEDGTVENIWKEIV